MKKFAFAATVLIVGVGFAMSEEFRAVITKVDGDKVTFHKITGGGKGKKGEKGEAMTLPVAKDLKVVKGKFNAETKKLEAGDAITGGLKADVFSKGEANVRITTDADNKTITQIMTFGGFGDKKKKKVDAE
jgi:hypothetical protein